MGSGFSSSASRQHSSVYVICSLLSSFLELLSVFGNSYIA